MIKVLIWRSDITTSKVKAENDVTITMHAIKVHTTYISTFHSKEYLLKQGQRRISQCIHGNRGRGRLPQSRSPSSHAYNTKTAQNRKNKGISQNAVCSNSVNIIALFSYCIVVLKLKPLFGRFYWQEDFQVSSICAFQE